MTRRVDPSQCKKWVFGGSWGGHQCSRKPWKDGFCKQHHPDSIKAADKKREAKYLAAKKVRDAYYAKQELDRKRGELFPELVSALDEMMLCYKTDDVIEAIAIGKSVLKKARELR